MFNRYGDIIREEALWNIPVISVKNRDFIERALRQSGKYPIRPPNEVTANYRKSRPDRYTNTGLVNECVLVYTYYTFILTKFNSMYLILFQRERRFEGKM